MDRKRWADPGDLKRCILRSRRPAGAIETYPNGDEVVSKRRPGDKRGISAVFAIGDVANILIRAC